MVEWQSGNRILCPPWFGCDTSKLLLEKLYGCKSLAPASLGATRLTQRLLPPKRSALCAKFGAVLTGTPHPARSTKPHFKRRPDR